MGHFNAKNSSIKCQFGIKSILNILGLAETMLLSLVKLDAGRDSLLQERLVHALSLVGRNDLVLDTLQKQYWAA